MDRGTRRDWLLLLLWILLISELNFKCCFQLDLIDLQWQFVCTTQTATSLPFRAIGMNENFSSIIILKLLSSASFYFSQFEKQFIHAIGMYDYYVFEWSSLCWRRVSRFIVCLCISSHRHLYSPAFIPNNLKMIFNFFPFTFPFRWYIFSVLKNRFSKSTKL